MTSLLCCLAFAVEGGHVATSLPKPLSPELPWLLEGSPRSHVGASRAIPKPGVPPRQHPSSGGAALHFLQIKIWL